MTAESAHSGSAGVEGGGGSAMYQDLPSSPGDVWTVSAWATENDWEDNGDGAVTFQVLFMDANGNSLPSPVVAYFGGVENWQQFTQIFPAAPAGTAKVRISFNGDQGGYMDDCAATGAAPVPRGVAWAQSYVYL